MLALFINAAILVVAAATFHSSGHADVAEIGQAFELLSPLLGLGIASTLFAIALLASGLNSTVTATLAGQIVMEGFLHLRLPSWARRLVTRGIAIVPVVIVTAFYGERGTGAAAGVQPGRCCRCNCRSPSSRWCGSSSDRAQDGRLCDLRATSPRWRGSSPASS